MSSNNSVELYGYCHSREETERVVSELDKEGISDTLIRVSGKGGQWQRVAKPSRRNVFKSLLVGLPVGAVVGAFLAASMRSGHAGAARAHMDWLSIVALIVVMALLWGGIAALGNLGLAKLGRSPGNDRTGNDRYLVTVRCHSEDRPKIRALLIRLGATITDEQGMSLEDEKIKTDR